MTNISTGWWDWFIFRLFCLFIFNPDTSFFLAEPFKLVQQSGNILAKRRFIGKHVTYRCYWGS